MNQKLYSSNPAVNVLKASCASPLALTFLCLSGVGFVLSIVSILMEDLSTSSFIGFGMAVVPVIGYLLTYVAARDVSHGGMKTNGFSTLRVWQICYICLIALAFLVIIYMLIVGNVTESFYFAIYRAYWGVADVNAMIITIVFILVVALALMIPYYIGLIKILARMRTVAQTGVADNRISGYCIGFSFAVGGLGALASLGTLFLDEGNGGASDGSMLTAASMLVTSTMMFLSGIWLSKYKKGMTQLIYQTQMQSYQPNPYGTPNPYNQATGVPYYGQQQGQYQQQPYTTTTTEQPQNGYGAPQPQQNPYGQPTGYPQQPQDPYQQMNTGYGQQLTGGYQQPMDPQGQQQGAEAGWQAPQQPAQPYSYDDISGNPQGEVDRSGEEDHRF